MFKDREKLYQAYHTVLTMALTWALVLVINRYFNLRIPIIVSAIYSFLPPILVFLFDLNKKNIISYLLIISILPMLALVFWMTRTNPISWIKDLIEWCVYYDGTKELYKAPLAHVISISIAILGAIVFYLITGKQFTKVALAAGLMITMIALSVSKTVLIKPVVAIGIFYILTNLVEISGLIYNKKAGKLDKKEGILYIAPICLLLAILSIALPSKAEPIQWAAIKNIYHNAKEQIEVWKTDWNYYFGSSKNEFFVNLSGYSEDTGKLENNNGLKKDSKVALKISGLDQGKSVYLMGSVYDIYSGSGWSKSKLDYLPKEEEFSLDYAEMFCALSRQDLEVLENNNFILRRTLMINYSNIKTKSVFYPLKMSWTDVDYNFRKVAMDKAQITFKKARGKGTTYQLLFYEMNLEGDAFIKMLRDADTFSYADYQGQSLDTETADYLDHHTTYRDEVDDYPMRSAYYELLGKRADMIEKCFTGLPENLPDRVYQLAEDITAPYDTKYDKLKAIEAYLRSNYTYSLEAQKVPKGQDFTDYFLFDNKKGYCTSFATSMAVLGRCIGIPTRYVEGFLGSFDEPDAEHKYAVKNSQAHAWTEAYIEGVGWIPFEATTPFYQQRYGQWKDPAKVTTGTQTSPQSSINPYVLQMQEQSRLNQEVVVVNRKSNAKDIVNGMIIFFSLILILLFVLIIYYYILEHRYKKDFEKADYNKRTYMIFLRVLRQLKREGFFLDQQETILMLSERVKGRFDYNNVTFRAVVDIFMRYRYAEEEMLQKDFDCVNAFYLVLLKKEKEEENRFKLWLEEFLFLARKRKY